MNYSPSYAPHLKKKLILESPLKSDRQFGQMRGNLKSGMRDTEVQGTI